MGIKILKFKIDTQTVSRIVDENQLSSMQKIRAKRANSRYGLNFNQSIKFSDTVITEIKKFEIVIKTNAVGIINDNGIIKLPVELFNFDELKNYIISNSELFKLKN